MKKFWKEFKEFALKGNVVDLAVGVIIGAAFKDIVNSLVSDIITPLVSGIASLLFRSNPDAADASKFTFSVGAEQVAYGTFLSAILNFFFMALIIFLLVKAINKLKEFAPINAAQAEKPAAPRLCPYCKSEIDNSATRCPHCTSRLGKAARNKNSDADI